MNLHLSRPWQQRWVFALLGGLVALSGWLSTDSTGAQQLPAGGGGRNIVLVTNVQNEGTQIRGMVQLNRIPGPSAAPSNIAMARNSCTQQCQSLAVALQINVISLNTHLAAPENAAVAVNSGCTGGGCVAVAWAIQYVVAVQDPTKELSPDIQTAVTTLNRELIAVSTSGLDICAAAQRINSVIDSFAGLAASLYAQQINEQPNSIPCPLP